MNILIILVLKKFLLKFGQKSCIEHLLYPLVLPLYVNKNYRPHLRTVCLLPRVHKAPQAVLLLARPTDSGIICLRQLHLSLTTLTNRYREHNTIGHPLPASLGVSIAQQARSSSLIEYCESASCTYSIHSNRHTSLLVMGWPVVPAGAFCVLQSESHRRRPVMMDVGRGEENKKPEASALYLAEAGTREALLKFMYIHTHPQINGQDKYRPLFLLQDSFYR